MRAPTSPRACPPRGRGRLGAARRRPVCDEVMPPPGVPLRVPLHPGRFLHRHYLAPLGMSQTDAARLLGMSRRRLHELVHGQRAVSPDTALRCALVFGSDAAFWLALQSAWDSFHAWKLMRARSRRAPATA